MGRTNARQQQRQRRTFLVEPLCHKRPLHEQKEKEEELVEGNLKSPIYAEYDEDDQGMCQLDDSGSIPTTMGVRVSLLDKHGDEVGGNDGAGYPFFGYTLHRAPSRDFREFVIPQTPAALAAAAAEAAEEARNGQEDMQQDEGNDDDISVLTEYSGMEEEEDASSQVTAGTEARTVVTTTTGSTTIPTRNVGQLEASSASLQKQQQQLKLAKRRNAAVDKNNGLPPIDNSQYKRRRMG